MTEHPDEALAEYVDDRLSPDDRARVESHLASCPACREEVALARHAMASLGSLPPVPVPLGATARAIRAARRSHVSPLVWRAAGLAAAAAVVVGAVIYLQRPGAPEQPGEALAPAAPAEEAGAPERSAAAGDRILSLAGYPVYEESNRNYDPDSLTVATLRFAQEAEGALAAGFPRTGREFYAAFDLRSSLPAPAQSALQCVTEGVPPDRTVVPSVIQSARFRDVPAYLVVFLRGPNAEAVYDRIQVLVVDRQSCTVLHFARHTL